MATIYRSTIKLRCWKEHTCAGCGGSFAYRFERSVSGRGGTAEAAEQAARDAAAHALSKTVDAQPCPTCGLYQPDMIASRQTSLHWCVLAAFVPPWGLLVVLAGAGVLPADVGLWLIAGVCAVAALAHLWIDARNPNRNLVVNRLIAQQLISAGKLHLGEAGSIEPSAEVCSPRWSLGHRLVFVLLGLSVLGVSAAEVMRLASDWPFNAGWRPAVVGPGESADLYLPAQITSIKGHWSGEATVDAYLSDDPKREPIPLTVSSRSDSWGKSIRVKASEKGNRSTLWVRVGLPQASELAGKSITLHVRLMATYPRAVGAGFETVQEPYSYKAELDVASAGAGGTYVLVWWLGVLCGGGLGLLLSGYLIYLARGRARQAQPTQVYPIEEERDV
jgi:hypothetical protein